MKATLRRTMKALTRGKDWLLAQVALVLLRLLRRMPAERALHLADRAARRFGPWLGRHRVATGNLRRAYPEMPAHEIEKIASDMWGNMARLAVEYVFLDKLFDYDPEATQLGRVEVSGQEHFIRIAAEARPHILFTGHLGNFELLPIAGATLGMRLTALFRPPNNRILAEYVLSTRRSAMGEMLPSRHGASFALSSILERGGNIGVLVDQKFRNGLRGTFFGQACETSPLLPKLVREHECDVYPARCIRLAGNRFRLLIEPPLVLPRAEDGRIDLSATAQLLNDVVERWVREDPGQWMWFHKRWGLTKKTQLRRPRKRQRSYLTQA